MVASRDIAGYRGRRAAIGRLRSAVLFGRLRCIVLAFDRAPGGRQRLCHQHNEDEASDTSSERHPTTSGASVRRHSLARAENTLSTGAGAVCALHVLARDLADRAARDESHSPNRNLGSRKLRRPGVHSWREGLLVCLLRCGAGEPAELAKLDLEGVKAIFADFHHPVQEVLAGTPRESLIWTDIVDLDPMLSFTRRNVALLGDAAHAVTPDLGQGAGLAIEDAAVLAALFGRLPIAQAQTEIRCASGRSRAADLDRIPALCTGRPMAQPACGPRPQPPRQEYSRALHGSTARRRSRRCLRADSGSSLRRPTASEGKASS